jgi:MFS family permease
MTDGAVARRNARLYLAGLTASLIGNSAMSLVAGVWVKSLTGSNALAGLVSACVYAPSLAAPLAGLLADRVDRRRWLVGINLVSAGSILILLTVRSSAQVWVIFVAMGLYGCEIILTDPSSASRCPSYSWPFCPSPNARRRLGCRGGCPLRSRWRCSDLRRRCRRPVRSRSRTRASARSFSLWPRPRA